MSELWIHRYCLPWSNHFSRKHKGEGALLAYRKNGICGYADLHPWPSIGDLDLTTQLKNFSSGIASKQIQLSLKAAEKDWKSRQNPLIKGLQFKPKIQNHHLFLDSLLTINRIQKEIVIPLINTKKQIAKWKISPENSEQAAHFLNEVTQEFPNLYWRLDANSLFSKSTIENFWQSLHKTAQQQIDFIEDPCPYNFEIWNELEDLSIPLAIDFEIESWRKSEYIKSPTPSGKIKFILKPAIHDMDQWRLWLFQNPHQFVITSYLDHPVGMLHALWIAESFQIDFGELMQTSGLSLSLSNQGLKNYWPELLLDHTDGNTWSGFPSSGIGSSQLLEECKWIPFANL